MLALQSGFQLSAERNFAIALVVQPIRSKIKTNLDLFARVFPRLASVFASSSDWLIGLSASVC